MDGIDIQRYEFLCIKVNNERKPGIIRFGHKNDVSTINSGFESIEGVTINPGMRKIRFI